MNLDRLDRIDEIKLAEIVDTFKASDRYTQFAENMDYFKGQDTAILNREVPDELGAPDNRIPVSYGRRIINLVTGYMYKPGLVQYVSDDEGYLAQLQDIFDANREPIKTEQMGKQVSIQGVGYEFHYVTGDGEGDSVRAVPRFVKLPANEVIPIYDWEVEPELWAFVRFLKRGEAELAWVYYTNTWEQFSRKDGEGFNLIASGQHYYDAVPLVVYQNNEEMIGDFEPVQHLIDAYDVLVSDSMNEFDRFAYAYLVMKGLSLHPDDEADMRRLRVFQNLDQEDSIEFLTKEQPTAFIEFMTGLLRDEIHRQSGIPNLEDYDAAGASGATMSKFIYLMELFTDPKESYFKQGLYRRIELIDKVLRFSQEPGRVEIIMTRNKPDASREQAEIFGLYDGRISRRTLIENFAPFVMDVDAELEALEEEKQIDISRYEGMTEDTEETEETDGSGEAE
jgi:SPP1 family phage portal protein